ncbi:hypothetical protein CRE_21938 [Caenorhabditis remanei]|uniref:Sdz-33 F-box domain-containing protein n=1 Tax=Caenorhabditis remanei TaxID=31234 RepID=E3MUG3_CAERE|nr:hypothetical protein CRE_21938 [Caenorhabditis remanei]
MNEKVPFLLEIGDGEYEPEWIQRSLNGLAKRKLEVSDPCDDERPQSIIDCFTTEPMFVIEKNPYLNGEPMELEQTSKFLMRNYDFIQLGHEFPMNLDLLLMTNSKIINLDNHNFSLKDLRFILRSWMHGALPNLQFLCFLTNQLVNQYELIHGIHHQVISQRIVREKKFLCQSIQSSVTAYGGFDIWKFYQLYNREDFCTFQLVVWN